METKNMKTKITINAVLLSVLAVLMFFSCDNPLTLGTKLDIEGPIVEISSPSQRKSVTKEFDLEGTVYDKSTIDRMVIYAVTSNLIFPRQWRYIGGAWQISDDYGTTWAPFEDAVWEGPANSGTWKIHVNMNFPGFNTEEGEYTFNVQAWDKAEFSDDNSFKAVVLIVDLNPPKVDISFPFIYRGNNALNEDPLKSLHEITNFGDEKENPAYLGKFITQEFDLKWQVDDINDVWSIDLRFYKYDEPIDDNPATALPDTYYYKFNKNLGSPPADVNPNDYIKPNGNVIIPDLSGPIGTYDQGGVLQDIITTKTTVKVVAVCYDAAGNPNQEKTLGYFIYWPRANDPWIAFTEGMIPPVYYPDPASDIATLETTAFTVFPGKSIKATAYQAYGVKKIEYSVFECAITGAVPGGSKGNLTNTFKPVEDLGGTISNTPYAPGLYNTIFPWDFKVPPLTGYYIVKATAFSNKDKPSKEYIMLFRVNDITFPDFPSPVKPAASEPLYLAKDDDGNFIMKNDGTQFTITGTVGDATGIESLCLVWINPESKGAAANAQLAYFREKDYVGWKNALNLTASGAANGAWALDETFELDLLPEKRNPNKLWKLNPVFDKTDPDTSRRIYKFEKTINLSDLNINIGGEKSQYLKSQMFLFRAENPVDKCTIITYAPQGDTSTPAIKINDVVIKRGGTTQATCYPNTYTVLPIFADNDTIAITGKWREDSVKNLNLTTFFKNYFEINVNNTKMNHLANQPALTLNTTPSQDADGTWDGTWTLTTSVGTGAGQVPLSNLKDTLVIDVKTNDIGGNIAQIGSSWLIKSDKLQLLRISSDKPDDVYGVGEQIEIFLEFSKPVKLNQSFVGTHQDIQLILSSASGNTARASYKAGQVDQNSRQYFVYKVKGPNSENPPGDNTATNEYLNVKGLYYNGAFTETTDYTAPSYPFLWSRGTGGNDFEEVRLTMAPNKTGENLEGTGTQYYVRTLPTNTLDDNTNKDYQFTLYAAKHIKIDTTPPKISSVSTTTTTGYYNAGDIYFTITFDEAVKLGTGTQAAATPQFPLRLGTDTTGNTVFSSAVASDVRINDKTITFKYTISGGDTSRGNQVYVASTGGNILGNIYDIAGNSLNASADNNGLSGLSQPARTLTGIYVETQAPGAPTVKVLTAGTVSDANIISQNVSGTNNYGSSGSTIGSTTISNRDLSNVYNQNLWLAIQGNTTGDGSPAYKCEIIEYSIDNGTNWLRPNNTNNTPFSIDRTGNYTVIARQIDKAGNISANSPAITFNWDPGALLTRISSTNANGIYTHVAGRNQIEITLNFRKPIFFQTAPTIAVNGGNSGVNKNMTLKVTNPVQVPARVSSLTYVYEVTNGNSTPANTYLDVTNLTVTNNSAFDGTINGNGVNVSSLITLPTGTPKLDSTKQFTVETGALTNNTPAFIADNQGGTSWNDETNANFHGIRTDDGSYWTTLQITFNHVINKGSGNITITQIPGTSATTFYRLPAVLTEAQYNRFRNISGFDTYYIKSTNGYINGTGSDTSTKYVLQYTYNPNHQTGAAFTGDTVIPNSFYDDFRNEEAITVNVNSQAVTISNDGKTLNIRLTGSSAPQVPGATYEVKWTGDLVSDSLGNSLPADNTSVALRGVAKPFIRIRKTQDTISTQTGSGSAPRLVATQPFLAYARIDCRTPNSSILYTSAEGRTNLTGQAPLTATGTGTSNNNWYTYDTNWNQATNPPNNTNNTGNNDTSMLMTRPGTPTNSLANSTQITLGQNKDNANPPNLTTPTISDVQGYQWWARAHATATVSGTSYTSKETEEVAYRTVISYSLRGDPYEITIGDFTHLESGDQMWIRGGDAISSSSIPGFPFTWEDNFADLANKRAGIRLMTLVSVGRTSATVATNTLNNSLWRFVTWDMNATAYVDFIRGRDLTETITEGGINITYNATDPAVAWQYGPKRWCYQRDGWTALKTSYPIYPGKHRWCDTGYNRPGSRGVINFSGTFSTRAEYTANNPSSYPGANQP